MSKSAVTAGETPCRPSPAIPAAPTTRWSEPILTPSCRDEIDDLFRAASAQPMGCVEPVGHRQPGGWVLATETWTTPAAREAVVDHYLARGERTLYAALNPRARRTWLLGRLAVKDAVVAWHADRGREVAPSTVSVLNDGEGRPLLARHHGADLRISIAHVSWAAVAIVADGHAVGIDLEEVADRPDSFRRVAFTGSERGERRAAVAAPDADNPHTGISDALWMAAAWCAKEAVGKALGTGLQGRPSAFATRLESAGTFAVRDRRVRWQVLDPRTVRSAAGRALVVGWTLAPAPVLDLDTGLAGDVAGTGLTGLDAALAAVLAAGLPDPVELTSVDR